eukprot:m.167853 g.167853  ORF g.167853 m.167853 type:complete len:1003 (+) comp17203_c1_seq2:121-3129(+)
MHRAGRPLQQVLLVVGEARQSVVLPAVLAVTQPARGVSSLQASRRAVQQALRTALSKNSTILQQQQQQVSQRGFATTRALFKARDDDSDDDEKKKNSKKDSSGSDNTSDESSSSAESSAAKPAASDAASPRKGKFRRSQQAPRNNSDAAGAGAAGATGAAGSDAPKDDSANPEGGDEDGTLTFVDTSAFESGNSSLPVERNEGRGLSRKTVPETFPVVTVLPVDRSPVFPKFFKPVEVRDKALIRRIKHLIQTNQPYLGAFLKKGEEKDGVLTLADIHKVGTFVQIVEHADVVADSALRLLVTGHRRIVATGVAPNSDVLAVTVENLQDKEYVRTDPVITATVGEIILSIREIIKFNPLYREAVNQILEMSMKILENPSHLADLGATFTTAESASLQAILEETDIKERLSKSLELLKQELLQAKLQHKIRTEVEEKVSNLRRQHLLHEQLNIIKRELGMTKDDKQTLIDKFKSQLKDLTVPAPVQKVIDEELNKLQFLEASSSEFSVTRNYLEWLTGLPWGKSTPETFDLEKALTILDEDHYGMKDVKDRVLEFIAVSSLMGKSQGKILCFVGPPGVGKTSIARSIAKALNRTYFRFSVGGLHDVAEIKGHRRTYVGAMPGKMIQCLKKIGAENPLVLIDEIDKIGRGGMHGDPTSALLELLDPEQNTNFLDHYLDVPVDVSKVLFVCTANVLDTIPGPLLDRMEVIELSGYMAEEKVNIAKKYLIPHAGTNTNLTKGEVDITDAALEALIKFYCRESGVRNLQKHVEKIFRKAALMLVRKEKEQVQITAENLHDFVGSPRFTSDRLYELTPPGIVTGLAWTAMGGSILFIETVATQTKHADPEQRGSAGFHITGRLGEVMKESATIAHTFARQFVFRKFPESTFFSTANISLHVPEGATPKDGPSAGITIVTALVSLASNIPVRPNLAMTGEVSLTGLVMRVGGIKEKILAAKRSGITTVILPDGNRSDFNELPESVRRDITVHFVKTYDEVFPIAFPTAA